MSTTTTLMDAPAEARYQLQSIEITTTPDGGEGTWYRYVIVQGSSEITGLRCGNRDEVDYAVREMVERLNERSAGKNSKKLKSTGVKNPPADVRGV